MPYSLNWGCRLHLNAYIKRRLNLFYGSFCTKLRHEVTLEEHRLDVPIIGRQGDKFGEIPAWCFWDAVHPRLFCLWLPCAGLSTPLLSRGTGGWGNVCSCTLLCSSFPQVLTWPVASFLSRWHYCIIALKEIQFIELDNWSALGMCEIQPCYWRPLSVNKGGR